jgi:hypothetical protein
MATFATHRQQRSQPRNPCPRRTVRRLFLEQLEDRRLMAVLPNDPEFAQQWMLHNTGQTGGVADADIDAPEAWSVTTGSMATVVAVLDSGIEYADPDLYLNIWLNEAEIPAGIAANLTDADGDGLISFRDLNTPPNSSFVTDLNANGYIDGGDLLADPAWENGLDDDGNNLADDLVGWDFHDNDNDPKPGVSGGSYQNHGNDQAKMIGAMSDNGIGTAGINWKVRIIPVRIREGALIIDNVNAAAGIDYAVASGAPISNNSWRAAGGGYIYSQEIYDAIERAEQAGHLFVGGAGNDGTDNDIAPLYPASYNLDNMISATVVDASNQAPDNYGLLTVDLGSPSPGGTSGASSHTSGVAAMLKSLHPDWTAAQIKDRILVTVDPLPSLAGKTVTGGRLNAASALGVAYISISDATATEGSSGAFTVQLSSSSEWSVTVQFATANGTAASGSDFAAGSGVVTFAPGETIQTVIVNTIDDANYEGNETFVVNLSNAVGGVIVDGQGVGTIVDNDPLPTKFYVVDDAAANKTFEYGASGAAVENYALNSGNAAPRGAASTVAGDKTWVVDANKKVFVYDTSGGLLGSWTAGTLAANAQPEGIATNGTDVWIVDAKSDKVFRYTGAASRLSGSQNAASSFNLASGNGAPTDLVTDGASFWVLNDNANDKVFKYTLAGSSLGNWTLIGGGGSPTGITLDPVSPSHLWIVDNATDRVYQYDNAVTRTSGSQAAASSFALAAGNTNPQGIGDPPPPSAQQPIGAPVTAATPQPAAAAYDDALMSIVAEMAYIDSWLAKRRK